MSLFFLEEVIASTSRYGLFRDINPTSAFDTSGQETVFMFQARTCPATDDLDVAILKR